MTMNDVKWACVVSAGGASGVFSKVYHSSNESLDDLFSCFSLKNKDVLTVLLSSDQLFYALSGGARSVETFDTNHLTKYYYYLRRWTILYQNHFYPSLRMFRNHRVLYSLLDKVDCMSDEEKKAFLFWKSYLEKVTPEQHA